MRLHARMADVTSAESNHSVLVFTPSLYPNFYRCTWTIRDKDAFPWTHFAFPSNRVATTKSLHSYFLFSFWKYYKRSTNYMRHGRLKINKTPLLVFCACAAVCYRNAKCSHSEWPWCTKIYSPHMIELEIAGHSAAANSMSKSVVYTPVNEISLTSIHDHFHSASNEGGIRLRSVAKSIQNR